MLSSNLRTIVSCCLLTGAMGIAAGPRATPPAQPSDRLALQQLQADFHGAGTFGDVDMMLNIWAADAIFSGGGTTVVGAENIVDFFVSSPNWGTTASLSPTYKSTYDIHGNRATIRFECVILRVDGSDPAATAFSSLPPGSQNPNVEIFQHSTATIEARKEGGKWVIETFNGAGGPILD